MLRRDFIKTTGAVIATAALPDTSILASSPAPSSRLIIPINRGWRFKADKPQGAEKPSLDDASFDRIVIPHTVKRLPWHNFDDAEYQFLSTYRRRFRYPAGADGKRVFVDFEGVMTASTVWINGHALGEYKGGFTPFSFELTPYLRKTGENILVVQVDSTERGDI